MLKELTKQQQLFNYYMKLQSQEFREEIISYFIQDDNDKIKPGPLYGRKARLVCTGCGKAIKEDTINEW
jgi:hypothetical protein